MKRYMKPRVLNYGVRMYPNGDSVLLRGFTVGFTVVAAIVIDDEMFNKLQETMEK